MTKIAVFAMIVLASLVTSYPSYAEGLTGNTSNGQVLFTQLCGVCHSLTENKMGPNLSGVYGRKAGTAANFNYSKAVQSSGLTWDAGTLDQWLTGPQKFISGARMTLNVNDAQKRADIIAYLKSVSKK